MMKRKIIKIGKSVGIVFPKQAMSLLDFKVGEVVEITFADNAFIIKKVEGGN